MPAIFNRISARPSKDESFCGDWQEILGSPHPI